MKNKLQDHIASHQTWYILATVLLMAFGGFALSFVPASHQRAAEAGTLTPSLASVYKGTLQIVGEGGSPDSLSFGAGGSVVAGTNNIFLRPNGSNAASYFRGVEDEQEQGLYLDARQWDVITATAQNNSSTQYALAAVAEASLPAAVFKGTVRIEGNLQKGDLQAVVQTSHGLLPLHVVEAPDARFIDYGKGRTENGSAHIATDPTFTETVSLDSYSVFLAPIGTSAALAVSEQTESGFTVRASMDTDFSYKIVATRKGYEDKRFIQ